MKVLIINLAQSTDRLNQQKAQFARLGLDFVRLPAVSAEDISEDFYLKHIKYGQRLIKRTEMACFLSHQKAWQTVLECNCPCVILEDDAVLVHDFAQVLADIEKLPNHQMDLINLEVQPRQKIVGKQPICRITHGQYAIYQLWLEKNGTGGYVLFPSGAKKLLALATRKLALADAFIYSCPNLQMYQIEPAVLLQDVICPFYDVPIQSPPVSLIRTLPNHSDFHPNLLWRCQFKKNRILTQISLGLRTLMALAKGKKRTIAVNKDKFIQG